ncbi:IS66 family insertion sequence element accessory protein TnpA [Thorsellia anophelis]|uniref:Uncharacterized protein n=1 Tax=Thorsellia anophelis DSM 18579 TaxID=1123402 RepID=A0A1H9Z864_9GAMM|nr:hypothetical protein [Thorsellia anophelis]SES77663.1 hypothetical protein SAMN02583745_00464 [Thorsellia anophelis DSM 18579]
MQLYSLDEKIVHNERYRASGLTRAQYANENGIKFGSFKNWPTHIKKAQAVQNELLIVPVQIQEPDNKDSKPSSKSHLANDFSQSQPHDDLSILLSSGLIIKCNLTVLPQVVKMMESQHDV